jgi:GNAT superfamily N-acetyltransferase
MAMTDQYHFREAQPGDIPAMHRIRMAVKENVLSRPDLVTEAHYLPFITTHGKGWVCEAQGQITGFAIIDTIQHNVWALFIHPDWEARGIGKQLQRRMLDWYFHHHHGPVWLSTSPDTRAERFYTLTGWRKTGITPSQEWRFEMDKKRWESTKAWE